MRTNGSISNLKQSAIALKENNRIVVPDAIHDLTPEEAYVIGLSRGDSSGHKRGYEQGERRYMPITSVVG